MDFVKTQDGSFTVFHKATDEHYHSISGAEEEAFEKYVNPLELKDGMKILDFCFGLGYNSFAAISKYNNLEVVALELDERIVSAIETLPTTKRLNSVIECYRKIGKSNSLSDENNNSIELILGDARETIVELEENYFDRVFFDPFSPSKVPFLWTAEVFIEVFRIMKIGGRLATYSCSKKVRRNMIEAGFEVFDGPSVGRRSPSTIALKK